MIDDQVTQQKQHELKYLLDDNLTQILYLLRTKVDSITKHLQGQVGHKYTHHDIQNELLNAMVSNILKVRFQLFMNGNYF